MKKITALILAMVFSANVCFAGVDCRDTLAVRAARELLRDDAIAQTVRGIVIDESIRKYKPLKNKLETLLRRFVNPATSHGKAILSFLEGTKVIDRSLSINKFRKILLVIIIILAILGIAWLVYSNFYNRDLSELSELISHAGAGIVLFLVFYSFKIGHKSRLLMYDGDVKGNTIKLGILSLRNDRTIAHQLGHIISNALNLREPMRMLGQVFPILAYGPNEKNQTHWENGAELVKNAEDADINEIAGAIKQDKGLDDPEQYKYLFFEDSDETVELAAYLCGAARQLFPDNDYAAFEFLIYLFLTCTAGDETEHELWIAELENKLNQALEHVKSTATTEEPETAAAPGA